MHPYDSLDQVPLEELLEAIIRRCPPRPGEPYPLALFNFLNAYRPAVTVEVVVLLETDIGTEVLVRERAGTDVGYAGTVHAPGSYLLNDETVADVLQRIVSRELGEAVSVVDYAGCGVLWDPKEERGHQLHQVFWVHINGPIEGTAQWVDIHDLPENLVPHHLTIIQMADDVFTGRREPSVVIEVQ